MKKKPEKTHLTITEPISSKMTPFHYMVMYKNFNVSDILHSCTFFWRT